MIDYALFVLEQIHLGIEWIKEKLKEKR